MKKELKKLLKEMGFENSTTKSCPTNNFFKRYGKIAEINVYELKNGNKKETIWDVNIKAICFENEMLSSCDLRGQTIKEHKQAMVNLFNDLELIDPFVSH